MAFSDSTWQDFPDTVRSTGAYIIFYQDVTIYHGTYVPVPVDQSSTESEYNASCTEGMALAHSRILIHELFTKDPDIVPEEPPLIILDIKSDVCMARRSKYTKHTKYISRRLNFVTTGENIKCTILTGVKEVCNW